MGEQAAWNRWEASAAVRKTDSRGDDVIVRDKETLSRWARCFGCPEQTLLRAMSEAGLDVAKIQEWLDTAGEECCS